MKKKTLLFAYYAQYLVDIIGLISKLNNRQSKLKDMQIEIWDTIVFVQSINY